MTEYPIWIPNPTYNFIKIANRGAEQELYYDSRYNPDRKLAIKEDMKCAYTSCETLPQTVCQSCNEYVCENHIYRHPFCEEGR